MDEEHGSIINIDWVSEGFWNRLKFHEYILFFSPFHSRIDALSFAHACMGLEKRDALGGRLMGCISVLFVITSALLCIGLPWNVHRIVIMRSLLILCVFSTVMRVFFSTLRDGHDRGQTHFGGKW
jgi:hypothetical protein